MSAKVAIVKCPDYGDGLALRLGEALELIGGLEAFVKPGQSVLIKPNLLTDGTPEQGKTTHPAVVRALVRLVKARGARPAVGDSPSTVTKLERVWEQTGIRALCEEEGIELVNFEKAGSERLTSAGLSFSVSRAVLEADVVINVPKVKTHSLTVLTAAVKNLYGTVPGMQKTTLHEQYANPREFGRLLAALYEAVRPALTIADAVVGMEGNGPSAGELVRLGFLAASADGVALDWAICRILRIDPMRVAYLRELSRMGLGPAGPGEVETVGAPVESVAPTSFRLPNASLPMFIPGWLVRLISPLFWVRPAVTDRCVACGRCVKACPAGALELGKGAARPTLDPAKCIQCFCCHEVCPERAIEMRASRLMRPFLPGGS